MPPTIDEVRQAYELLGVPYQSYSPAIKAAYRTMAKRWHPDLFVAGSEEHRRAVEMMQRINVAYQNIKGAPLRYYVPRPASRTAAAPRPTPWPTPGDRSYAEPIRDDRRPDRVEFWIRFFFGALFGLLLCFRIWIIFYRSPVVAAVLSLAAVVGMGFGAARGGDSFWYRLFGGRWSSGFSRWPW